MEQRCPCCFGELSLIEYAMGPEYGQFRLRPLYCGLRCDLFYDDESKIWRDFDTWEPWDGMVLEEA